MDFSTLKFCSESKRSINFPTFLSPGSLIHQSSNMGIHQSEGIPFVELTGHKVEEAIVHSPFRFDLAKSFGLANNIHNLANNTKNSMKDDNFFHRKDMYSHQFPAIAFSQLVGGFVGSKSQVGSSGRESCQIWDIVIEKLAEFCGNSRSEYHTLFSDEYSESCYNLGKEISQEFLGSLCQKSVSTGDTFKATLGNTSSKLPQKVTETIPRSHSAETVSCNSILQPIVTMSMGQPSSGIVVSCHPDFSKQSYAEVARTFAIAQQNKQLSTRISAMHKARNSGHCEDKLKRRPRTFGPKDSLRYSRDSIVNNCRNRRRMGFNNNSSSYNRNNTFVTNLEIEGKTERNKSNTNMSATEVQRIDKNLENMKSPVQSVPKEPSIQISYEKTNKDCPQAVGSCIVYDSSKNIASMEAESSVKPCSSSRCSPSEDEVDDCVVFACKLEVGSMPLLIHAAEKVQVSPKDSGSYISSDSGSYISSEESSPKSRFSSECSTDSDDSFVIFESNVECDAVFVSLMHPPSVSDSEISEDGFYFELSSDEECDDDDVEDTETITEINEVNEKWQKENSKYSRRERFPVKVQFASDSSLETIHQMVVWNHAYRAARRGPWEQMARDRERFTCRIRETEPTLAPVLSAEHRLRIWKERFADGSSNLRSQVT